MGCRAADKHSIAGFEVEVGGRPQMSSSEVDFPKWKKKQMIYNVKVSL